MSRYQFQLAEPADDFELRQRMAEDWMPGNITVSFRRDPNYFIGGRVQGDQVEVIKCTDILQNRIIGLGSRAMRDVWLNGRCQRGAYLSDLRAHPDYRNGTLLGRGYRYLKSLHEANPVPLYYTMIFAGNELARRMLTSQRASLPVYQTMGRFLTPAIHLDLPKPALKMTGVTIRHATPEQLPEVLAFIQAQYQRKQMAPAWREQDIGGAQYLGLEADDMLLAMRGQQLIGTLAAWDQREFRQTYVERYSTGLKLLRPLYNGLACFTPLKPLPKEGKAVAYFYLSCIAIENDDTDVFRLLLRQLYCEKYSGPWHYFVGGLHERDPLLPVLLEYRHIYAAGILYAVYYAEDEHYFKQLDERVPFVEIGSI